MKEEYFLPIVTSPWDKRWTKVDGNIHDRPRMTAVMLKDEIHFWTVENNMKYDLYYAIGKPFPRWFLIFENNEDAMLFKLTWG